MPPALAGFSHRRESAVSTRLARVDLSAKDALTWTLVWMVNLVNPATLHFLRATIGVGR
jgi:hypothetical protein